MLDVAPLLARVPDHREFLTFEELRGRAEALAAEFPGLVRREQVGVSAEGRPIELLSIGHGRRPALLVGAPHPNEPVGTLTIDFLSRLLCEDDALRAQLDVTLHSVLVADPDGLVLNEGWFKGRFSPQRYALQFYRPPHHEQVEWSFPVDYKTLHFTKPAPETAALMRVMERTRPRVFYSLHNAAFCGVYLYVSELRPGLADALHGLAAAQGLPLHRGEPEVPYLRLLAPAVYRLFGVDATYEYLARTLGEDPAPYIEAGTCADDWLTRVCDAFSIVCEVPYYTAPALVDVTPAGISRRVAVLAGLEREDAVHGEIAAAFDTIATRVPEHRLRRSVVHYLRKTPARLTAERAAAAGPEYEREATRAEAIDATTCKPFHHVLYLGEVHRLAELAGEGAVAARTEARVIELMAELVHASALEVLPLRPLVAMQAGAGLLALSLP